MELEMHCMEMDLHFGIAEKECKMVWLRNYVYIIDVTFYLYAPEIQACLELTEPLTDLAPVVQKLDSAIHWINHYPVDRYLGKPVRYSVDRGLSSG